MFPVSTLLCYWGVVVCLLFGEIKILFLCPNKFLDFFACYEIHAGQLFISLIKKNSATLHCRFLIMNWLTRRLPEISFLFTCASWGTALQAGRSRVRFPMVSLEFFIDIVFLAALWPWGWLSLQQKWVPGIFPGGKGGWCLGLTILPHSRASCLEIRVPQPRGTLWACPGL